jgi:hypothetical protein
MATEVESTEPTEESAVDQQALGLSKHVTAWRASYGDDVVDAALQLAESRRPAVDSASAGRARAASGQKPSAAPTGRSASDPKSTATSAASQRTTDVS